MHCEVFTQSDVSDAADTDLHEWRRLSSDAINGMSYSHALTRQFCVLATARISPFPVTSMT